ncbi:MAG: SDR family oxidoreductase [Planctomycetota bacterium]
MSRVWFLTGCSSGIGWLLAQRVLDEGDWVVATARDPATLESLSARGNARLLKLPLDVTRPDQVAATVARAYEHYGRLDVLVNNAGYGYFAPQEEADLVEVEGMFATNVFGLIRMTQAVLPIFREAQSGVVVNLSSMAGRIATPRGGFYQASKWAVEALSEALSLEVANFGIRVVVIEPGRFDTRFSASARPGPREQDAESPYAELRKRWTEAAQRLYPDLQDPREVVDATWGAVAGNAPFVRVPVGRDSQHVIEQRERLGASGFVEWMRSRLDGR